MVTGRRRNPREQTMLPLGPSGARPRRLVRAVENDLRELRRTDRLDAADHTVVAACRDLARLAEDENVDPNGSRFTAGVLVGRLLDAHRLLKGPDAPIADDVAAFLASLRTPHGDPADP
jgi:hypothetical protein